VSRLLDTTSVTGPAIPADRDLYSRVRRAWRTPRAAAITFGSAAAMLALIGSWIPSLWGDEAASVMSAERPVPSLLRMLTHVDAVHGTYYLALHGWISVFGASPFSVRLPSAFAAGLTVAAVVLIAWRLASPRAALVAGVICCVLPRVTYMGEEARSYAFSAAIASWLTLLLVELLARRLVRRRWWILYGVGLVLGTYLFLYTVLIVIAHAAILLRARPGRRFGVVWLRVVCASALTASPLIVLAYLERAQIAYLKDNPQVTFESVFTSLWFGAIWFAAIAWALILIAIVHGLRTWRRERRGVRAARIATPPPDSAKLPGLTFVAAVWLVIPSAMLIGSQVAFADFTARYLTFCAPAAALLMAAGLLALTRARARWLVAGLVVIVAAAAPVYVAQRGPYAMNGSDWAEVSATVGAHAHPGDAIVFDESARPSRRPQLALHTYPAGFAGLRDVDLETPFTQSSTWYDRVYTVTQAYDLGRYDGVTRVWLVEYADGSHVDRYGIDDLEDHGYHESAVHYRTHTGMVYLFER
jgi:mannosyltransferase